MIYFFGDFVEVFDDYVWFIENVVGNDLLVGVKWGNLWGLYDIYGYFWEWCFSDVENLDWLISLFDE